MTQRNDFSYSVKRSLAERAGYRCSFPGCKQTTIGPSEEDYDKSSSVGMACHIAAAAGGPGARRFVKSMRAEERSSQKNGIWMCYTHGKLIDTDETRYTIPILQTWKKIAERSAQIRLETGKDIEINPEMLNGIELPSISSIINVIGEENLLIGNTIHDSCLKNLWGVQLTHAIRDYTIEIVRNAFLHGGASNSYLSVDDHSITIIDNGEFFNSLHLYRENELTGGQQFPALPEIQ